MNHPSSIRHLLHHLNFLVPRTRYLLHFQVIWAIVQDYIHGQVSKCYVITVPGTSLVLYITQAEAIIQHHHRESVVLNVVILKALGSLLGYLLRDSDVSTLLLRLPVGGRGVGYTPYSCSALITASGLIIYHLSCAVLTTPWFKNWRRLKT